MTRLVYIDKNNISPHKGELRVILMSSKSISVKSWITLLKEINSIRESKRTFSENQE